jgi:hypothetical protein
VSPRSALATLGWADNELKSAAFVGVSRVAAAHGVPVVPVKGVLTAHILYADPSTRPMVDVDVRVRARDLDRLCAAGQEHGWRLVERSRAYCTAAFEVEGERVELESHLGPPGFCRITADDLVARATEHVEPFGVPHLQPEVHDHALLMLVNVFKDQLVEASHHALLDLVRIAKVPGFSFPVLAERARDGGVATLAWLVAEWMEREKGQPRWAELRAALGERPPRPRYAAAFRFLAIPGQEASLPLRLLVRAAPDALGMQVRALARTGGWMLETLRTDPGMAVGRLWPK